MEGRAGERGVRGSLGMIVVSGGGMGRRRKRRIGRRYRYMVKLF